METIRLLDCTLRDGGYINDWDFKRKNIRRIMAGLEEAGTDLIEAGFLRDCAYREDRTLFNSVQELKQILPEGGGRGGYVLMALHDKYDVRKLEENDGTVEAIRVTFHDYDVDEGLEFGRRVMEKGYRLFVNPINIMGYSDSSLLRLLEKVRELGPYGFSIVDTFGSMTKKELVRISSLCENNLDRGTVLGLHLHENMAQSFLLAQTFLEIKSQERSCVLDASLNGMGRVPGNLCMELIMDYLNRSYGKRYDLDPVLDVIETCITPIREKEPWGYMAEYFLSAKLNLHRNYAEYLLSRGNLTARDMHRILQLIPEEKKSVYDERFVEKLYRVYEDRTVQDQAAIRSLGEVFAGRTAVLLAPGKSLEYQWDRVRDYIREKDAIPVSANFYFEEQQGGYAFFSNAKRYDSYRAFRDPREHVILTSNITRGVGEEDDVVSYGRLAQDGRPTENCGVLLLRLMRLLGAKEAALAGFDGYSTGQDNYMKGYFGEYHSARSADNEEIAEEIREVGRSLPVTFLTPSLYEEAV